MTLEDRQLRQLFAEFDLDGSGELDRGEIAQVMSGMGSRATETELDAAMVEMDADGSGEVDFDEVCVRVRARVCSWCASPALSSLPLHSAEIHRSAPRSQTHCCARTESARQHLP